MKFITPKSNSCAGTSQTEWAAIWRPLVAFVLLPNLLFAIVGLRAPLHHGFIDLTYVLVGLLVLLIPSALVGAFLYVAVLFFDIVRSVAGIYYFTSKEAFQNLSQLRHAGSGLAISACSAMVIPFFVVWFSIMLVAPGKFAGQRKLSFWSLASVLLIGGIVWGQEWVSYHEMPPDAVRQPVSLFAANEMTGSSSFGEPSRHGVIISVVHSRARQLAQGRDVVFVLEESMGQSADPKLTNELLSPLTSELVHQQYDIARGTERFYGSTLNGEEKTLCSSGDQVTHTKEFESYQADCLPNRFRLFGYKTYSFHGYTAQMFDRVTWYPLVGFEHRSFREEQQQRFPQICGKAFPGTCDDQMAQLVTEALYNKPSGEKRFIYFLTLNSHLPVDASTGQGSDFNCSKFDASKKEPGICNLSKVLLHTNEAIAKMVLDPRIPPTVFILMGDHAPPFRTTEERSYYDQQYVPYVILTPKQGGRIPSQSVAVSRQADRVKSSVR